MDFDNHEAWQTTEVSKARNSSHDDLNNAPPLLRIETNGREKDRPCSKNMVAQMNLCSESLLAVALVCQPQIRGPLPNRSSLLSSSTLRPSPMDFSRCARKVWYPIPPVGISRSTLGVRTLRPLGALQPTGSLAHKVHLTSEKSSPPERIRPHHGRGLKVSAKIGA